MYWVGWFFKNVFPTQFYKKMGREIFENSLLPDFYKITFFYSIFAFIFGYETFCRVVFTQIENAVL